MTAETILYDSSDSPLGRLWIALSPRGVCRIAFDMAEAEFVAGLRADYGVEPRRDPERAAEARRQIGEYLSGKRVAFELPLDLDGVSDFQRRALTACAGIPYGQTRSYAELARELGQAGAARAVGGAMAHNPLPLIIPCHRVLRSDGGLGGFGGGLDIKRRLLDLERAHQ